MQILIRHSIIICIILYPLSPIISQSNIFTLEKAVKIALENNRDVIIAEMNVEKAEAAIDEAFGYALPSLDITANFSHFLQKPRIAFPDFEALLTNATYDILFDENVIPRDEDKFKSLESKLQSFAQTNNFETKAEITQVLFNSAVFRGIGASKIYLDLSKVQFKLAASKTILEVSKAFYSVLLAKELLDIMEVSLDNAEENLGNVKALNAQGLTSDFDALQVEVQVENLKPRVNELRNVLENAKNGFKILLGLNQSEYVDVKGEFIYQEELLPNEEESIETALISNLDVKTLKIKKQVDEEFIAIERSDYWPTIAAFGNFTYAGSSDEFKFQTYNASTVGVSFTMNLFRGGRVSKRVQQAVISTMQTEKQISLLKDFVTSQVKSKILELERVKSQVNALNRNVELAAKAYDISTTRYQEGSGTQLEIKNADVELRNAKITRIKSVHDYIIAKAELNELLGIIDEQYLSYIKYKIEN